MLKDIVYDKRFHYYIFMYYVDKAEFLKDGKFLKLLLARLLSLPCRSFR